jgi:ABC-type transport system involved in cytochrome c biogenesis ATPase subunit
MRLTRIDAHELFSFDRFELGDLPDGRLVVVGPNGAGKTNMVRLLEVVHAAIERAAIYSEESRRALARFAQARRVGAASTALSSVRLGILLTEEWEHDLLTSFVRAAIGSGLLRGVPTNSDTSAVIDWIKSQVTAAELAPLVDGQIVIELVDESIGQWAVGYDFRFGGETFRWVIDGVMSAGAIVRVADLGRLGVSSYPLSDRMDLDDARVPRDPFTFAALVPPPGEARMLSLEAGPLSSTELVRQFAARAGVAMQLTQNRSFTITEVLRTVLGAGLVLFGDLRQPPRKEYTVEQGRFDPPPTDGGQLPLRLFRLKNGDAVGRARYANTQDLFTKLTRLALDITLAQTEPSTGNDSALPLLISAVVDRGGDDLPIEFAGGGIWEALLLSATLADSAGRVAILDEPARNLHPTLQRRLLTEMRRAAGQILVTTHSPYMVSLGSVGL